MACERRTSPWFQGLFLNLLFLKLKKNKCFYHLNSSYIFLLDMNFEILDGMFLLCPPYSYL